MKKQIYDEKNGMSYTLHGDYYLPDLVLREDSIFKRALNSWLSCFAVFIKLSCNILIRFKNNNVQIHDCPCHTDINFE